MNLKHALLPALGAASLVLAGCLGFAHTRNAHATSVMQFLYPRDSEHIDAPGVPVLRLPLHVGVAFVPTAGKFQGAADAGISAARKTELLKRVAAEFRGLPYIGSIEVIPTTYLRPEGGFENLEQVKSMFNVDVIALVAYDQIQFTDEGLLSLAYWTIVGAYVVQGEKNDTQTLMEAAVYDIASRKLLFRAPGTSQVKATATPVNLGEQLRMDSRHGFDLATTDMIVNLKSELDEFKARVKESPGDYTVVHGPGYTGGGALDGAFAVALAGLAAAALYRRK